MAEVERAISAAGHVPMDTPAYAVTVIAITRVVPITLLKVEPAIQRQFRPEQGLGYPHAETVLQAFDDYGYLGLRDASDELLDGLRHHTRGFLRALVAVKASERTMRIDPRRPDE